MQEEIILKYNFGLMLFMSAVLLSFSLGIIDTALNLSNVMFRTFPNKGFLTCIITLLDEGKIATLKLELFLS